MSSFVRISESEHINQSEHQEKHSWNPAMQEAYSHGARESFRQHHHNGGPHRHNQAEQYLPEMQLVGGQSSGQNSPNCAPGERPGTPNDTNNVAAVNKTLLDLTAFLQRISALKSPSDTSSTAAPQDVATPGNSSIAQVAKSADTTAPVVTPSTDSSSDTKTASSDTPTPAPRTADTSSPTPASSDAPAPATASATSPTNPLMQLLANQTSTTT